MIEYLLTELNQARQEDIWHSVIVHKPGCAGPYAMTSSQKYSCLALTLSQ